MRTLSLFVLLASTNLSLAFQGFKLPQFFSAPSSSSSSSPSLPSRFNVEQKKAELLKSISNTSNGKTATIAEQISILQLVRELETKCPSPPSTREDFFADPKRRELLDGVWFLQYTSPSEISDVDDDTTTTGESSDDADADGTIDTAWKPTVAEDDKIETRQLTSSQGSVSAAGIKVDVSNKPTQQIIDMAGGSIINRVELDLATVVVGGSFRPSDRVCNRALASFNICEITFPKLKIGDGDKDGLTLNFGFLFNIAAIIRGTPDNGWLEFTYLDESMRIGRGNKGTMFILTRDSDAVQP